ARVTDNGVHHPTAQAMGRHAGAGHRHVTWTDPPLPGQHTRHRPNGRGDRREACMTDAVSANRTTSPQGSRDTTPHKKMSAAGLLAQLRGNPRVPLLIAGAAVIAILIVLLL